MTRSYSMRGVQAAAERAVHHVRAHLLNEVQGSRLHDVSLDPRFQHRGVDLLWEHPDGQVVGIEVKGDRQPRQATYFLELVSNLEKDTPGCFLYSRADWLAYVFLSKRELHLLPLPAARAWFLEHAARYPLKHTRTRTGALQYTTVGAVVPVADMSEAEVGLQRFGIEADGSTVPLPALKVRRSRAKVASGAAS
jgi:hypothetical protein